MIGTWNVRTLRGNGKIEQLEHEMKNYRWNILGLCEVRFKDFGEVHTTGGHKLYYSGSQERHEQGVGFLVNKENVNAVLACQPISSRIMTLRLRSLPFNITIIQVYAPTSEYDDEKVDEFYEQIQEVIAEVSKKNINQPSTLAEIL